MDVALGLARAIEIMAAASVGIAATVFYFRAVRRAVDAI